MTLDTPPRLPRAALPCLALVALAGCAGPRELLAEDRLIEADLFSPKAEMMSAAYAFEGIIGVEGGETEVRAAGGTWNHITCSDGAEPDRRTLTSSVEPNAGLTVTNADAMPIVFSWPYLTSTLATTDFSVLLNDGSRITPEMVTFKPNYEYNERQVAVLFGELGNRLTPDQPGAIYPVRVEIVEDDDPLMLVGPDGPVSAVGLGKHSGHAYVVGPGLVAAKLTHFSTAGEGGPKLLGGPFPNDGVALYGEAAKFRLRLYTSGGFSPDGVRGIRPDEYEHLFRLHATDPDGDEILLEKTGTDYAVADGQIRIIGLADLGLAASSDVTYDDCYVEDWDNYIDIVLDGDEAAMRSILSVEIPATAPYGQFFNPGGPGNTPTPGARYTEPGAPQVQTVTIALDDPMTVSYE